MNPFLIVCPLVFLAGFVDSVAGGGGLISLPAFLLAGLPPHMAIGTNKLSSAMGTTISTARFVKNRMVNGRLALLCIPAALLGAVIGSKAVLLLDEKLIRYLILFVLPVVSYYVIRNRDLGAGNEEQACLSPNQKLICVLASFVVGMYDGFYGPGTGTFLLLIYTGAAKLNIKSAAGLTKVVNLSSNIAALGVFITSGKVDYLLGLVAACFCVAGHYLGSGMVMKSGNKVVRPVVLCVLCCLFVKILTER